MTQELEEAFKQIAEFTRQTCMGECFRPGSCCSPEYCDMAIEIAAESGVALEATGHATLPMMGPEGCVAPPHFRPLCSLHVCCINGLGFKPSDPAWTKEYFRLRRRVEILLQKSKET